MRHLGGSTSFHLLASAGLSLLLFEGLLKQCPYCTTVDELPYIHQQSTLLSARAMLQVGYGDIGPTTALEEMTAVFLMLIGERDTSSRHAPERLAGLTFDPMDIRSHKAQPPNNACQAC